MFCPKCKSEYIEGYTHCKKCDIALVEQLPDEPYEHKVKGTRSYLPSIDPVAIKYVSNAIDAEMTMAILRNNDIPCFKKSREAGGYMGIYMGFSIFGEDIYVDRKNAQAALDLLNDWNEHQEPAEEEPGEPYDNTRSFKRHHLAARVFAIYFAALAVLALLYGAVNAIQALLHN